jgi:PTH1 family peptidyl-tRNA hydrolase
MTADNWLIVGLGNPGENYRFTRHNVGFRVVEALVIRHKVKLREKDEAIWGSFRLDGHEVFLFFPQTFMNESGRAVGPFARYQQIPLEQVLVISDDLDLPVGKTRLKISGGSGGHHGLDSIISHLGSSSFPRLRIGVGKPPSASEGPDHVLSTFHPDDKPKMEQAIDRAIKGVETYILKGSETAMREINGDLDKA